MVGVSTDMTGAPASLPGLLCALPRIQAGPPSVMPAQVRGLDLVGMLRRERHPGPRGVECITRLGGQSCREPVLITAHPRPGPPGGRCRTALRAAPGSPSGPFPRTLARRPRTGACGGIAPERRLRPPSNSSCRPPLRLSATPFGVSARSHQASSGGQSSAETHGPRSTCCPLTFTRRVAPQRHSSCLQ